MVQGVWELHLLLTLCQQVCGKAKYVMKLEGSLLWKLGKVTSHHVHHWMGLPIGSEFSFLDPKKNPKLTCCKLALMVADRQFPFKLSHGGFI